MYQGFMALLMSVILCPMEWGGSYVARVCRQSRIDGIIIAPYRARRAMVWGSGRNISMGIEDVR